MTIRRPLDGMLVLDLGQIYNGPYCRPAALGFMGARVLKIEPPEGDVVRRRKREVEPYPLVMLNSNKESVVLDLKQPRGKEIFLELVDEGRRADRELRRRRDGPAGHRLRRAAASSTRAWSMAAARASASTVPIAISPPWTSPSRR